MATIFWRKNSHGGWDGYCPWRCGRQNKYSRIAIAYTAKPEPDHRSILSHWVRFMNGYQKDEDGTWRRGKKFFPYRDSIARRKNQATRRLPRYNPETDVAGILLPEALDAVIPEEREQARESLAIRAACFTCGKEILITRPSD